MNTNLGYVYILVMICRVQQSTLRELETMVLLVKADRLLGKLQSIQNLLS